MSNPQDPDFDPFADPNATGRMAEQATAPTASMTAAPAAPQGQPPTGSPTGVPAPASPPQQQPQMEFYNPTQREAAPEQQQAYNPNTQGGFAPSPTYQPSPTSAAPAAPQQQQPQPMQQMQLQHQQQPREGESTQPAPTASRELESHKFWTLGFYQQFFDVDAEDVMMRMTNVLLPVHPPDFLRDRNWHMTAVSDFVGLGDDQSSNQQQQQVDYEMGNAENGQAGAAPVKKEARPDMYGPFWICTTLWITLAIVGNMMSKISHSHEMANRKEEGGTLAPSTSWTYDFTQASVACATIYCYTLGMSVLVWGLMKWKSIPVSLVDTLALYGYSMFIFLLAAILCAVPNAMWEWFVCLLSGVWSSAYLLVNFWHVWKVGLEKVWFVSVVSVVLFFHILLTMSFKLYFFNYDI